MPIAVPGLLLVLAAALAIVDCIWAYLGHFSLDLAAYLRLALMSAGLMAGAAFYRTMRPEPRLAAMLFGAGFLCAFSAGASVLNYFLLTVVGKPIDPVLMQADHMLGFDWYRVMRGMADHPYLNEVFFRVYNLVLPQMALLLVSQRFVATTDLGREMAECLDPGERCQPRPSNFAAAIETHNVTYLTFARNPETEIGGIDFDVEFAVGSALRHERSQLRKQGA